MGEHYYLKGDKPTLAHQIGKDLGKTIEVLSDTYPNGKGIRKIHDGAALIFTWRGIQQEYNWCVEIVGSDREISEVVKAFKEENYEYE